MTKKSAQLLRHWTFNGRIILWFNISPNSFSNRVVLVDELAEIRLCGFALAIDRLAKARAYDFNALSSNCVSEVSCSLSSFSLLLKSVTNLFKP